MKKKKTKISVKFESFLYKIASQTEGSEKILKENEELSGNEEARKKAFNKMFS